MVEFFALIFLFFDIAIFVAAFFQSWILTAALRGLGRKLAAPADVNIYGVAVAALLLTPMLVWAEVTLFSPVSYVTEYTLFFGALGSLAGTTVAVQLALRRRK